MNEQQLPVQNPPARLRPLATIALIVSIVSGLYALVDNRFSSMESQIEGIEHSIQDVDDIAHEIKEQQAANEVTHTTIAVESRNLKEKIIELRQENTLQHGEAREERHDIEEDVQDLLKHAHDKEPEGGE